MVEPGAHTVVRCGTNHSRLNVQLTDCTGLVNAVLPLCVPARPALTVDTLKAMSCVCEYSTVRVSTPPMDACISRVPPALCSSTAATATCTLSTDLTR